MKYLFRNCIADDRMLATFLKDSSDTHPDHHDYHPHYELYFRRHALPQDITLNGVCRQIQGPAIVLTAPFQIHAMSPTNADCPRYERHIVYFNQRLIDTLCDGLLPRSFFTENANVLFPLTEQIADQLEQALPTLFDSTLPERERVLAFGLLLARLDRLVPTEMRQHFGQINAYIPQVLQYLYDHVSKDLTAEQIAARFHVSRAKLNRDFRTSVGQSLHAAVMDLRFSAAKTLLVDSNRSVGDIAAACGFSSEYYFHAFFKRMTDCTPLGWRKRHSDPDF